MSNPSQYFSELLQSDKPVERQVVHNGKAQPCWFRRVTAGERVQLMAAMRLGEDNKPRIDLGEILAMKHLLVLFSAVQENGQPLFAKVDEVRALPDWLVVQLARFADEINSDEEDPGKS